jgi:putative solute:sodium symporter small subunit
MKANRIMDKQTAADARAAAKARRIAHWRRTRRLTAVLLGVWLLTGFCSVFYARELFNFTVFGWPLSFYMAAQGSSLIYLALIAFYALRMGRLDRRFQAGAEGA